MESLNSAIEEFLKYPEKNKYYWNIISNYKKVDENKNEEDENEDNENEDEEIEDEENKEIKKLVYFGENKKDKNEIIFVKQINLNYFQYNKILKEIYFLLLLKNHKYFVKLINILISEDKQYLCLVFNGNKIALSWLIGSDTDYLNNPRIIKKIIYQISFGLYFLHSKGIIHNDIKPSNILINNNCSIEICDFSSTTYNNELSDEYTLYYASPEFLINKKRDEKSDMWSFGIIIIELFLKKNLIFKKGNTNNKGNEIKMQIEFLLERFGIKSNILDNLIKKDEVKHIILQQNEIEKINDKNALYLIHNLLVLNPNKRFTARQVLQSKYLQEFKEKDSLILDEVKNPLDSLDYKSLSDSINKENFYEILNDFQKDKNK